MGEQGPLHVGRHVVPVLDALPVLVKPSHEGIAHPCGLHESRISPSGGVFLRLPAPERSAVRIERHRLDFRPLGVQRPRVVFGDNHVVLDSFSLLVIPTQELVAFPGSRPPDTPIRPSLDVLHGQHVVIVGSAVRVERHRLEFRRVVPVEAGSHMRSVVCGEPSVSGTAVPLQIAVDIGHAEKFNGRQSRGVNRPLREVVRAVGKQLGIVAGAGGSGGIDVRRRVVPHAIALVGTAFELPDDGIGSGGNGVSGNGGIGKAEAPDGRTVGFVLQRAVGTVHGGHDNVVGTHHEVVRAFDQRVGLGRGVDELGVEVVTASVVPVVVVVLTTGLIGLGPHVQIVGLAFFQRDAERIRQVERSRVGNGEVVVARDAGGRAQPKVHVTTNLAVVPVKPEVHVGTIAVVVVVPNLHLDAGDGQIGQLPEIRVRSPVALGPRAVIASDSADVDARAIPAVVGERAGAH